MNNSRNFLEHLGAYFTTYMKEQKGVSPHTIDSYLTTFKLLLDYAELRLKKKSFCLTLEDIDAKFLGEFLKYLEYTRAACVSTRNARLAAIRSFYKYLSSYALDYGLQIRKILIIPNKKHDQQLVDFLTEEEVNALLTAPNQETWIGKRDHTFLLIAIETGFRISELKNMMWEDVSLENSQTVRCLGKGRKKRSVPLRKQAIRCLREWFKENNSSILFPTIKGGKMDSDTIQYLLKKYISLIKEKCPSLKKKHVTPHVLRHTFAMRLLQSGVDLANIAILLGHESIKTTYLYLKSNTKIKEEILKKMPSLKINQKRYVSGKNTMKNLRRLIGIDKEEN